MISETQRKKLENLLNMNFLVDVENFLNIASKLYLEALDYQ